MGRDWTAIGEAFDALLDALEGGFELDDPTATHAWERTAAHKARRGRRRRTPSGRIIHAKGR